MTNRILILAVAASIPFSAPTLAQEVSLDGDRPAPPSASADAAKAHIERIEALDDAGPMLNTVIVYNPGAPALAAEAEGKGLPLAGRTVLVKDNIETYEFATTAGSLALKDNRTARDAPLIAKMREAGGVVLGKANLSEWANIRSNNSTSGWSAIGGLTRNPHAIDRNTCGSSSGSGAAVAAGLAWAAIGTETDGSITCPASINGIVGFKPTVGLVSRTHIVPISASQDTAGPMAETVADAALLLSAIAGSDPADPATVYADQHATDYTDGLATASLKGIRIGVLNAAIGNRRDVAELFEAALADMRSAGAEIVEIDDEPDNSMFEAEFTVLLHELREGMDAYLQSLPGENMPRSLADLVQFNLENAKSELRWFGQELFEQALETTDEQAYLAAREKSFRLAGPEGIDRVMAEYDVQFLIAPTVGPAWTTDLVNGDSYNGSIGAGSLAAIAGYPHLTVPMGAVEGLPVGISFMAGRWQDQAVLKAGAAYERARTAVLPEPSYLPWSPPLLESE